MCRCIQGVYRYIVYRKYVGVHREYEREHMECVVHTMYLYTLSSMHIKISKSVHSLVGVSLGTTKV